MEEIEYRRLARMESDHWWYQSINSLVLGFIKKSPGQLILDAGCGTGGLTSKLTKLGKVTGVDISPLALSLVEKSSVSYVNGSVNKLPFRSNSFDLIASISVLYHQRVDDVIAANEMNRVLKKSGLVIVVLPAFFWLASIHDKAVHTKKRYSLRQAEELMRGEGFKIIDKRYLFSFLFPIFMIKRIIEKLGLANGGISDLQELPGWLNKFLIHLCRIEWIVARYIKLPFGSSLIVVAQK